jgi:hypothetical protein
LSFENIFWWIQPTLCVVLLSGNGFSESVHSQENVDFENDIRPLLKEKCIHCHGPADQNGGLRLDSRKKAFAGGESGPVILAGDSKGSELIKRLLSEDDDLQMPPENRLDSSEIDLIRSWVEQGAKWVETKSDRQVDQDPRLSHWSFQPLKQVIPPRQISNNSSVGPSNTVDLFIQRRLKKNQLRQASPADRRTLIRRLFLDVTGLPPTADQVQQFINHPSPAAYANLVDRVLGSPRYGERWAQHWLDLVRYADTHGFEVNTSRENAWPYRDYVISAFNHDRTYDQFIKEQLAGDFFKVDEATGFLVASAVLLPGQIGADDASKRLARQDELDEMVVGTGGTFLGLSIGCARCHDHKFDPITSKDYYSMQAFFAGVDFGDRQLTPTVGQSSQLRELGREINRLEERLEKYQPFASIQRTLILDEQDKQFVEYFYDSNGPGVNPQGQSPGYRDDAGAVDRNANVSGGRYLWWNNVTGKNVMTYTPGVEGKYRLWISWGVHGSGVHTRDARYLLDLDGDLSTEKDQQQIAKIDQYYRAGIDKGLTPPTPVWSGFLELDPIKINRRSKILLRGGKTGTGVTADVIVLQEFVAEEKNEKRSLSSNLPSLRAPVNFRFNVERFKAVPAKYIRLTVEATNENNRYEPCIDELEVFSSGSQRSNVALASAGAVVQSSGNYGNGTGSHQLSHINDGRYGNSFSWISSEKGGGWVQVQLKNQTFIDRIVWSRDRAGEFRDRLATQYRIEVSTDGEQWEKVAGGWDRAPVNSPHDPVQLVKRTGHADGLKQFQNNAQQLSTLLQKKRDLEKPRLVYAGKFRKPDATFVLRRGDPEMPKASVSPAIPSLFESHQNSQQSPIKTTPTDRRLALANWIASAENPLTARVMVNRIWQYHFGIGLVDTPSDFGLNGSPPTHPDLLDWLAGELINSGWSVKQIHRLILNSSTYRQSSRFDTNAAKKDFDNRWLWRFPARRLESEAIRDSMLAVSGELNLHMKGPGFDFFKARGGLNGFPPQENFGAKELRRMIYSHKVRMESVPVFGAFDCPDAGQPTPERIRSTTAIQALNLFNSEFVTNRAEKFAKRVQSESNLTGGDPIQRAFQISLSRVPSDIERKSSAEVVQKHGLATLCRVLLNSSEFLFLP